MSADENTERDRRQDDSLMRKIFVVIIASLILMVITETGGLIYIIGVERSGRLENKRDIVAMKAEIQNLKSIDARLIRIETQMETVANLITTLAGTMQDVAYEQQRRTSIVNQAGTFMTDHMKEHERYWRDK